MNRIGSVRVADRPASTPPDERADIPGHGLASGSNSNNDGTPSRGTIPPPGTDGGHGFDAGGGKQAFTILVAEDNEVSQLLLLTMLRKWGHEVVIVDNGLEAVDAVRSRDFDMILMDISMPRLDGVEATKRIRKVSERLSTIPIVAVTADTSFASQSRYRDAGIDLWVPKPIDQAELKAAIAWCMAKRPRD